MSNLYTTLSFYYKKPQIKFIIIILSIIIPLVPILFALSHGYIALWYDPARDLLEADRNLHKLTLIGPTSGIPGIFYGPYWIWLLSLGLLVSKDPVVVTFLTATLPYFVLFPFIWFKFRTFFGLRAVIIGWLFFIFSTGKIYASALWNPYPAVILTLAVVYLTIITDNRKVTRKQLIYASLQGLCLGLIINFHISFGIGFLLGFLLYKGFDVISGIINEKKKKNDVIKNHLLLFSFIIIGLFFAYIPALIFESRHGFHQIQILFNTFSHYGAVVDVKGLSKIIIAETFFSTFEKLLYLPAKTGLFSFISIIIILFLLWKNKNISFTPYDKKIIYLLSCLITGIAIIYLSARNPVWNYHFISVEIIFLVFLAFIISKIKYFHIATLLWIVYVIFLNYQVFLPNANNFVLEEYNEKNKAVKLIIQDAANNDYSVYAFNTSIYTYDYSYLFKWHAQKDMPFDPSEVREKEYVYLIIPSYHTDMVKDFVHFRGPESRYKIEKIWTIDNNLEVIRKKLK